MMTHGRTLVTGASAGIGAALAREFASHKHSLVLVARSKPPLEALAAEIESKHGVSCDVSTCDLATETGPDELSSELFARGIHIDILVNNAGVLYEGPFWETPLEEQQRLVRINVGAVVTLTHRLLPPMLERGRGRILNVASASAFYAIPRLGSYAASKAFLVSLTEALSVELSGTRVTATALCPGFTDTRMIDRRDGKGSMRLPFIPNTTTEKVAEIGYDACMRGAPVQVVGLVNTAVAELVRRQPRRIQRAATGLLGNYVLGRRNGVG